MNRKSFFTFITLILPLFVFSQTDKGIVDKETIKEKCQAIIEDFTKEDIAPAFDKIRALWVLPENELDHLEEQSIKQLNLVKGRFGESIGNKFVKENLVDDLLYQLTYVVKYEKHALRFRFIFYHGKGEKWYLNSFKWDDKITDLLKD